jgi:hypothetical protein
MSILEDPPSDRRYYYGISAALLAKLKSNIPEFSALSGSAEEENITARCGGFNQIVGFHGKHFVLYTLLVEKSGGAEGFMLQMDLDAEAASALRRQIALDIGDKRMRWARRVRRGYCGWLMTNRDFLSEHDAVFKKHRDYIPRYGCNVAYVPGSDVPAYHSLTNQTKDLQSFNSDFEDFCQRWHLEGMAGPYLPVPHAPHSPLKSLAQFTPKMMKAGVLIYIPHIFALPSENELRSIIGYAQREDGRQEPHLAGWLDVVATSRPNKGRELARYGRIFEVQHFLRLLRERYSKQLINNKQRLMRAFAELFGHSDIDTIKNDFSLIEAAAISDPIPTSI